MKKRKVLVLADSPTVPTGFAQVSRNVLAELAKTGKYEIEMIGINYSGHFDKKKFADEFSYLDKLVPAKHPGSNDVYGREYTLQILEGRMAELRPPWDIFFTIQDHFVIEAKSAISKVGFANSISTIQENTLKSKNKAYHFMWVGYYPVDGKLKQTWIDNAIAKTNFPVAYCDYGKNEILKFATKENKLKERLSVIRHGTNIKDFYPQKNKKKQLRQKYFKDLISDDTFLIININRNQIRKDFLRTLQIYREFRKKVPNSFLYLHCNPNDTGGNIFDIARMIGLDEGDFGIPVNFNEGVGVPIKTINDLYNCADCVLTTTLGEGWGLSITEAMACKTPILAPNITSIPEILNSPDGFNPDKSRGIVFEAGKNASEMVCFGLQDNEVVRPVTNVEDGVKKLLWLYNNKDKAKDIVERAYKYATDLTWENECKKWVEVFDEAVEINDRLRKDGGLKAISSNKNGEKYAVHQKRIKKLGRNDPCPLCLNNKKKIKVKKCKEHRQYFL